jgi:DnaJ-domain-containing protein 1
VDRDRLLLGLAATFAGLTALLTVAALAVQPFLLFVAIPFGLATYFLWYQATGRLEARTRRRSRRAERQRATGRTASTGPRGEAGDRRRQRPGAPPADDGPSRAEAYRRLGLEPGANDAAVKRAYRERVKEVHPDTADGDQETFKRVTRAYERLTGVDS